MFEFFLWFFYIYIYIFVCVHLLAFIFFLYHRLVYLPVYLSRYGNSLNTEESHRVGISPTALAGQVQYDTMYAQIYYSMHLLAAPIHIL